MKSKPSLILLLVLLLGAGAIFVTWRFARPHHTHDHDHDHNGAHPDDEMPRGPRGGVWLQEGAFALELKIYELGVPPEFRAFPTLDGRLIPPAEVDLTVTLERLGGRRDLIRFRPEGEYLLGQREVDEPHSFEVEVVARHAGREYLWQYHSFEGRTEIGPEAAARAGIVTGWSGPATLAERLTVHGRIRLNEESITRVRPHYSGLVRSVARQPGDAVRADEVLAIIEASESLQTYEILAPRPGTVVSRQGAAGEFMAAGETLYVIADTSTVWVDLHIPRAGSSRVQPGQPVRLSGEGLPETHAQIARLLPWGEPDSQSLVARVLVANPDGVWRPGWVVRGEIQFGEFTVPVAVHAGALQTFQAWTVVFLNQGETYEALPVRTGRRDGELIEITEGLAPGLRYVTENSFLIKADILKSGATHDH